MGSKLTQLRPIVLFRPLPVTTASCLIEPWFWEVLKYTPVTIQLLCLYWTSVMFQAILGVESFWYTVSTKIRDSWILIYGVSMYCRDRNFSAHFAENAGGFLALVGNARKENSRWRISIGHRSLMWVCHPPNKSWVQQESEFPEMTRNSLPELIAGHWQ